MCLCHVQERKEKENSEERSKKTNDGFLQEHETEVKKMKEEFVKRKVKLKEENDEMVCYFCGLVSSLIHSGGQIFTLQCFSETGQRSMI